MFYRVSDSIPGYPPSQRYSVAAYETPDFKSYKYILTTSDGARFVATLEEAHRMIPATAKLLSTEPIDWFVELWGD